LATPLYLTPCNCLCANARQFTNIRRICEAKNEKNLF